MDKAIEGDPEVLIIEDNAVDAMFIEKTLRNSNIADRITTLGDGKAALDFLLAHGSFKNRKPDCIPRLIFLDLKMPRMDGFEFLHQFRSLPKFGDIPVVVFTGSHEENDKKMALDLGADNFYTKPVGLPAFVAIVEEVGRFWLQTHPAT